MLLNLLQTNMISIEALPKIIDTNQLTVDLEGTLSFDHSNWLETRFVPPITLTNIQLTEIGTG